MVVVDVMLRRRGFGIEVRNHCDDTLLLTTASRYKHHAIDVS